jgi:hypothetical protein
MEFINLLLLLLLFLTSAWYGIDSPPSQPGRFTPLERVPVPIEQEAEWIPKVVWTFEEEKNLLFLPEIKPTLPQPVAYSLQK